MTLAARRSAALRERFVMRLGCVLVSLAVLASLVLEPPRAKAFAVTSSAITALAGGFLAACGLAPVVSGMGNTDEVNESMARLIWDYLTAKRPGVDILHWLGDIKLQLTAGNKLLIPALAVGELTIFAKWVAEKYGTKPGENVVYQLQGFTAANGLYYELGQYISGESSVLGTNILNSLVIGDVWSIPLTDSITLFFENVCNSDIWDDVEVHKNDFYLGNFSLNQKRVGWHYTEACFVMYMDDLAIMAYSSDPTGNYSHVKYKIQVGLHLDDISFLVNSSFSVDVSETMQDVLDRLTTLEEGQSVALDVGATSSMEIQEILQGILDAILAGDLAASAEIVDTAEVPVDPPPEEETPDIEGLGLPALGAALITRFPFSIPWDIYKGVSLLAAPPKAPYFEVDFLEPIAYRVGGWRGNTTIVLDFSEYEVIGQICRWTSTIGFCLFLASATKRLIWTA